MRRLFILITGFVLIFGLFAIDKVFGCGCADSSCTCDYKPCDSVSMINCVDITTWYHKQLNDVSSPELYRGLSFLNKRSFKESDCKISCNDCCNCHPCGTKENPKTCCYDNYDCEYNSVTCQEWEDCESPTSCGDRGNCICNINYCKGWCKSRVSAGEIPVYDGPNFANCGGAAGDCSFGGKYSKYERNNKKYTHEDYDSIRDGDVTYSTCTCSWCTIKNFYECDSAKINDSHPCSSKNCAPDFAGGRNYCCPYAGQCAHFGADFSPYRAYANKGTGTQSEVYCFNSGTTIQYQGYKFKCNNGNWEFMGGEKNDFSDNCGKTIFNYPLFFNLNNFYPSDYGYKNSYAIYPISFKGTKDIVVSVTPAENFVDINVNNGITIEKKGNEKAIKEKAFSPQIIKFKGNEEGKKFNLTVNCYTPDEEPCYPEYEDCWPGSYCSQDNPTNIIEYKTLDKADFYCCPTNSCAHNGKCYPEGIYNLSIPGESAESSECIWKCKNNKWSKQYEGEVCYRNCDCANATKYHCVKTLYNLSKKICCPIGECALEDSCVKEGERVEAGKYKNCICNGDGSWNCMKTRIKSDYSRILFSKNSNKYEITLEIRKRKLNYIDSAKAKLFIFFDTGTYNGNIEIKGSEDCSTININRVIEEKITKDLGIVSTTEGFKCKLEIKANLDDGKYFFYTGSALILDEG